PQCDAHLVDDKTAAQRLADRAVALQVDDGAHRPGRGLPLGEHHPHALAGDGRGVGLAGGFDGGRGLRPRRLGRCGGVRGRGVRCGTGYGSGRCGRAPDDADLAVVVAALVVVVVVVLGSGIADGQWAGVALGVAVVGVVVVVVGVVPVAAAVGARVVVAAVRGPAAGVVLAVVVDGAGALGRGCRGGGGGAGGHAGHGRDGFGRRDGGRRGEQSG